MLLRRYSKILAITAVLYAALFFGGAAQSGDVWVVGGEVGVPLKMPAAGSGPKEATVSTAREFCDALASNTVITLNPGMYEISEIKPVIEGFENLTIRGTKTPGGEGTMTDTSAVDKTVPVLFFKDCKNLTLEYIVAGHINGGEVGGAAIALENCENVTMKRVVVYGSAGAFRFADVSNVAVSGATVFSNTDYLVSVTNGRDVKFSECEFSGNAGEEAIKVNGSFNTVFERSVFKDNDFDENAAAALNVEFDGCSFD
jgi:hypothetical protein